MSTNPNASRFNERDVLAPPPRSTRDARSFSNTSVGQTTRTGLNSVAATGQQGSFNADLKSSVAGKSELERHDYPKFSSYRAHRQTDRSGQDESERRQAEFREQIDKETKIKIGSENLLEALNVKNAKQTREQRLRVESELKTSNRKIAQLKLDLAAEIERSKDRSPSPSGNLTQLFREASARSPPVHDINQEDLLDGETESPTFVLAQILQALEEQALSSEFYVEKANELVVLLKRHQTLKYDLVWSIFGFRMQALLLSESREVRAASFRVLRHAITDRKSLSILRSFKTDFLVTLALVKESKDSVEREQALKFVRAFLDVKEGALELSIPVLRAIVSVAEHHDDRLRSICVLTLAELVVRRPELVLSAGGFGILSDALSDGNYHASESLLGAFLYLSDTPESRRYLSSGHELQGPFSVFTDGIASTNTDRLRNNARVIACMFKTWTGLFSLTANNYATVKSLSFALLLPSVSIRDVILDLLFEVLRIKAPSWSSSFLAGRRLTTYGRVTNLKAEGYSDLHGKDVENVSPRQELVEHFCAFVLTIFVKSDILNSLLFTYHNEQETSVKRKTTLLLGEILNMAYTCLPRTWSLDLQTLPSLFSKASSLDPENRSTGVSAVYQIDSVNRTLYRTHQDLNTSNHRQSLTSGLKQTTTQMNPDVTKSYLSPQIEEATFRSVIADTQVLNTVNFSKWRWDLIQRIIEGPLLNPKRFEEAIKTNKFVKRIMGFYRPFKYRFSMISNTKPNQRYVRAGCALFNTMLQTNEGLRYLAEHKLLSQISECLAQFDRLSGLTSNSALFSPERLAGTLSSGYFAMLGVICSNPKGLLIMERWKWANMFYHIVELEDRDDLIKILLGNMDYRLDSHLRVVLSKALTSCSKEVRVFATRLLRKYATRKMPVPDGSDAHTAYANWAIQLLATQLYDPEIEVCEIAVRILEEACNDAKSLEYVVRCRPALDHLGEIGAPLLLRFLSTSIGYHYLDGLDYISQEMDDWFLGRNDLYVVLVEASLAKALSVPQHQPAQQGEEAQEPYYLGTAPPHFYRELTRTAEGCQLLRAKGHFKEFVAVIREHGLESHDKETVSKVKSCLWAVGNVGSMELGAPFLEELDVVETIIKIAESSEVMSIRGTAVFVLGLISRTVFGQEALAEHGWDVAVDELGNSIGICIPSSLDKLFTIEKQPAASAIEPTKDPFATERRLTDEDPVNARILTLVADLGNTVLTKSRAAELHSIKAKKAPGFESPEMFHKVMHILEQHHFRLPVLRFVFDLFDRSVLRAVVQQEDDDSDSSNRQGDSGDTM